MVTKRKASGRKSFTGEAKAEALRLLREGYTRKDVAAQIGCSTAALQLWKVEAKAGKIKVATNAVGATESAVKPAKKIKKTKKRRRKNMAKTTVVRAPATKSLITFDEFVQEYWSECPAATDIMRLSPDLMPTAVRYVNNVLRYAYDQFNGE